MRLSVYSDLHLEFKQELPSGIALQDYDVLVLAGDITTFKDKKKNLTAIRAAAGDKPIIFVPGNHEFYGSSLEHGIREYTSLCNELDIDFLYNGIVMIDGREFVGSTLWSTMDSAIVAPDTHDDVMRTIGRSVADFRAIHNWSTQDMLAEATASQEFIRDNIDIDSIVITHFPPLALLANEDFDIDVMTNYFVNDMVLDTSPHTWIYGHVHYNKDIEVNGTRFVSNQGGYPSERRYLKFKERFIIDV